MNQGVKTILFATNLTRDCMPAFTFTVILALKFKAKMVILHVLEKLPDYAESRLEGLLGEDVWKQMRQTYENEARQALIGKRSSGKLIRKALEHITVEAGIDEDACGYESREIVIGDGNVVDNIIKHSKEHDCDLIVLGGHGSGLLSKSVSNTVKSVLQRSRRPVLVVPSDPAG